MPLERAKGFYGIANSRRMGSLYLVTIQEIKSEVEALPADERRRLAAFLVSLRHKELAGYRERMAEKINDQSQDKWLTLEELDQRLES